MITVLGIIKEMMDAMEEYMSLLKSTIFQQLSWNQQTSTNVLDGFNSRQNTTDYRISYLKTETMGNSQTKTREKKEKNTLKK